MWWLPLKQNCLRHNWDINFLTDSEHGLVEVAQSRVYKEMKIQCNANCGEWYKHFTLSMTDWPVNLILLCSNVNICKICSAGFVTIHPSEWTSFYELFYCPASGHRHSSRAFGLYLLLHSDFHPSTYPSFLCTSKPPNQTPSYSPSKPRLGVGQF